MRPLRYGIGAMTDPVGAAIRAAQAPPELRLIGIGDGKSGRLFGVQPDITPAECLEIARFLITQAQAGLAQQGAPRPASRLLLPT